MKHKKAKEDFYQCRINEALAKLATLEPESDEAKKVACYVETLETSRQKSRPDDETKRTIIRSGVAVGSVLLMLGFERNGIITTKVLPVVSKLIH